LPSADAIAGAIALGLCLSGCGLLEVGPASKITRTEPVSVRVRVVELGPLAPERVAFPGDAPIAEAMPGDRVRFEIEVVDIDGLALPDEQLDSLWFVRTNDDPNGASVVPLSDPRLDQRCDELEVWTVDTPCRLGEGRSSIEFEVPSLGAEVSQYEFLRVSAVIAWNGQSAEECWAARRANADLPSDCGYINTNARLGPAWQLLAYAVSQGLSSEVSLAQLHPAMYLQQANRVPELDHILVELEGTSMEMPAVDGVVGPIAVDPGQVVNLTIVVDENQQFFQSYFAAHEDDLFYLFPEWVGARVATAGPISVAGPLTLIPAGSPIEIVVEKHAEPGIARVVLAVADERGAETVVRVELAIQ
jgi:hypothetical protein